MSELTEKIAREHGVNWIRGSGRKEVIGCACGVRNEQTDDEGMMSSHVRHVAEVTEAAVQAEVRRDEREKVAREIEALKPALTQWIEAYETRDAAVWAESPDEGAADLVERIDRIARGGGES